MVMPCDRENQDSDRENEICVLWITSVINCYLKIRSFNQPCILF